MSLHSLSQLNVTKLGTDGPHLLMLHGWGQSLNNLRPLGDLLSHKAQVHLIDLPGFGGSLPPPEVWNTFQYADYIVDYLNAQKIDTCMLLGHSFGGKVALSLAITYPQKVDKLILMASSGLKRSRTLKDKLHFKLVRFLGKALKNTDRLIQTNLFKKWFIPNFGSQDYRNASPEMRAILVKSVNEDLTSLLKEIKSATLILWGREDAETPVEMAKKLHKTIHNSQLIVFEDKGHFLHQDCGSHLCANYIIPFISKPSME